MSRYLLEVEEIQKAIALLGYIDGKLDTLSKRITKAYHRLDTQHGKAITQAQSDIYYRGKLYDEQWEYIRYLKNVLQAIVDESNKAESEAKKIMEGEWVEESKKEENKGSNTIPGSGMVSSNVKKTVNGAPQYKLPDYVTKNVAPDQNGIYGPYVYHKDGSLGSVCEWNIYNERQKQLSCTYYTLRKLNERGMSFPCVKGPGNGADWYGNFDDTVDVPRYQGNNSLEQLINGNSLPQENIVVSFASNPSSDANLRRCGHVMLIDRIEKNSSGEIMISYSDNYPDIQTLNGTNATKTTSLRDFMQYYNRWNGSINGIVVLGAAH